MDENKLRREIQKQIMKTNVSVMAKIVSRASDGTYTVEKADGITISGVRNQAYTRKWQPNQWVMMEFVSGDWVIVGLSPSKGAE